MGLVTKELKNPNQYELKFQVARDVFDAAVTAAFKKNAKKIRIEGFRPGKAPRHLIEQMYGKDVFYNDAIDDILPAAYEEAAKESELTIVGQPSITDYKIEDDGVLFTAEVYVKPELKLAGYKGLVATKAVKKVTDADVNEEIERVRKRNGRKVEVTDRPAQLKDTVNINYSGSVDGVQFDGGTAENQDLELGSGSFIPGFEDQVCGHSIGDEFDVCVTFPKEYHAAELAGKAAVFACKLNGISVEELPVLDDEFAKDVSEFDTLKQYKADIKAKLQKKNEDQAERDFENEICQKLIELVQDEIPEVMYDIEVENVARDYDNRFRAQGFDLNTYLTYLGQTLDQFKVEVRPTAINNVKLRLALEAIAKQEALKVTDEVIDGEYQRIADAYQMEVEKVKSLVERTQIEQDMLSQAALDFVKAKAKVKK